VKLDDLLKKWLGTEGGAERANYQMFLTELCQALGLPAPNPKGSGLGDYQFEAPVKSEAALGTKGTGRIDLYKRDHFILEAKQSQLKPGEALPADAPDPPPEPVYDLFGNPVGFAKPNGKTPPRYDRLMADARLQAERYALALPGDHKAPPFLIVCDIGRAIELYFDWSGNGRGYGFFPDRQNYRIALEDLTSDRKIVGVGKTPRELLAAIWTDPAGVDPRLRAAEVTRDIAIRLSRVAAALEQEQRQLRPGDAEIALGIEATSLFLMRMLFCMFAEDVELLPKDSFKRFLADAKERTDQFWRSGLADLWSKMNQPDEVNRYWSFGDAVVRYFNGNLFASARIFDLPKEFKGELLVAAEKDWRAVEPAIFGTLLEQVLTAADRARLGAHYTPRAYVERLVDATIMEVLRPEWDAVRDGARSLHEAGDDDAALDRVRAFHERLSDIKVLDPACGTGNFLYVAMEELLRLEAEALQLAAEFGAPLEPRVHPNQFLGLELNPRAAVIAELVLWIGWLRHRLANHPDSIGEPVLPPLTNINSGTHGGFDALLVRAATGEPDIEKPCRPPWPEADFIVGNPPFIGGKDLRSRLDADHPGYAEALWAANPNVPPSADFVMQWWDRAADILTRPGTRLRRFGLVTTNSITQVFSRRVIERWLNRPSGKEALGSGEASSAASELTVAPEGLSPPASGENLRGLSLTLAIPSHPWTRASPDAAAVRIAMTVAEAGSHEGRLIEIMSEEKLDTDEPELSEQMTIGRINADLTVGTDVTALMPLKANGGLCSRGVQLMGGGFIITPAEAKELGLGKREGLEVHIRPYLNGRDLLQRPRRAMVIDLYGLSEHELMDRFPEIYDHVLQMVRDRVDEKTGAPNGRSVNRRETYKKLWWIFGEPRSEWRSASAGISRFIATAETSKHRIFQFLGAAVLPDNMIVAVASDDAFHLGVLQSRHHQDWVLRVGGWLGLGNDNRYNKSKVFDPFPFPNPAAKQREAVAGIAERLDSARRQALAENDKLTITGLYNLVEAVRAGELSDNQERAAVRARARIVAKLHDDLDAAVAAAYGWPTDLPGSEVVTRLVALNAERAAEEKSGKIRWLRPDYQEPKFGKKEKHA
jgi:hypothetical protein